MKRQKLSLGLAAISTAVSALSLFAAPSQASSYLQLESLTDRCSGEVIVIPGYNSNMETPGAMLLKRDRSGNTPYTSYTKISNRHIRWFCQSRSKFKDLDPGTWRIEEATVGTSCEQGADGMIVCKPSGSVKLTSSAKNGWFAERSRCPSGTTHIRARLGSGRLLRIRCYKFGPGGGTRPQPPVSEDPIQQK